jgi:hypothetical protein
MNNKIIMLAITVFYANIKMRGKDKIKGRNGT